MGTTLARNPDQPFESASPSSSAPASSTPGDAPDSPASALPAASAKKGRKIRRKVPAWMLRLLPPMRYKGVKGGRGGGKSHGVAELKLLEHVRNPNLCGVFIREVQKSIKDSVKRLLEQKIRDMGLEKFFDIKSTEIRMTKGSGVILFQGMADHTAVTIKSLEGMDYAVIEEAQTISERSLKILLPTIRKEGSEIWALWNPQNEEDPIHAFFCGSDAPENSICVTVSYLDNPYASQTMLQEAERDRVADPDKYANVWMGECEKHAENRIFKKLRFEAFDTPKNIIDLGGFRFGLDWGFSVDPLVAMRGFVDQAERRIYIDYTVHKVGCEVEDTPALLMSIPGAEKWTWTAGRERPERISSLARRGFKIKAAMGGNHSEMAGVEYLQGYEIVIHTRNPEAWEEFKNYKHPIDKLTGKAMPVLPTKKNHFVEAARYMIEDVRRFEQGKTLKPADVIPIPIVHRWNRRG